jgi:hypothetical protein
MLKVSYHAHQRREAPYGIIRKEVVNGIEIQIDLARTLLDRADNRRFKEGIDKFILRKDLLGMYILTQKDDDNWIVVTHIDLSDAFRQRLLRKLYPRDNTKSSGEFNQNLSVSNAILTNYNLEEINQIKAQAEIESQRFLDSYSFPCSFQFEVEFDGKEHVFQISKASMYRITKLAMVS